MHFTGNLKPSSSDLDLLIQAAGGVERVIRELRIIDRAGLTFANFIDLLPVLEDRIEKGKEAFVDEDRQSLVEALSAPNIELFATTKTSLQVDGQSLDALMRAAGGRKEAIAEAQRLNASGRTFKNVNELTHAISYELLTGCEDIENDRIGLVSYLSKKECQLFAGAGSDLKVTASALDAVLMLNRGLSQTIEALNTLNDCGKQFTDFKALQAHFEGRERIC